MLAALRTLEQDHDDIEHAAWTVQTHDHNGWRLGADSGFPDAGQRELYTGLGKVEESPGYRGLVGTTITVPGADVSVDLDSHAPLESASHVLGVHLDLLPGTDTSGYSFTQRVGSPDVQVSGEKCSFADSELGTGLRPAHQERCEEVSLALAPDQR